MLNENYQLGLLFGLIAVVIGGVATRDSTVDSTCTFTFHVPRVNAGLCLAGGHASSNDTTIATLQEFLSSRHAALEEHLEAIKTQLNSLGEGKNNGNGGSDNQDVEEQNNITSQIGTHYVQWGKPDCPGTAKMLYNGYTGKSYYSHGGGVNYLCLPRDPEFPEGKTAGHQSQSHIYGTEYQHHNSPVLDSALHDNDVPCAVCEVEGRGQLLMIPAKKACPSGWVKEYQGLLMSQHHTHQSSEYICVADGMQSLQGGSPNHDGGLLYVVEAVCGSLPCPPYTNGYEIACVICTK